jgi:hypothetical protein
MNAYFHGMSKPSSALGPTGKRDLGSIVDLAVRYFYLDDIPPRDTVARLRAEYAAEFGGTLSKDWESDFELADRMVQSYVEWLEETGSDAGERTMGAEVEITVPMGEMRGDNVYLVVHVDRLVLDTQFDDVIIDDIKTAATLAKGEEFQVDDQLLTYALVFWMFTGKMVTRARHTTIKRVKRTTAAAKPPFVGRAEVNFTKTQLENHYLNLWGALDRLVESYQELENGKDHHVIAPPSPSRDCSWKCDFLPICVAHDDGTDVDGLRSTLYVPYPERRQ